MNVNEFSPYLPDQPETPCAIVDVAVAERNITRLQSFLDSHGLANRLHIKTHKLPEFALKQIAAGAVGITCQKIGEAEVMAAAGIDDILISYNILGAAKLSRLRRLAEGRKIRVVAVSEAVASGLSEVFSSAEQSLEVLVECDIGLGRCGVQSPEEALALARHIESLPGLAFAGLMNYPQRDTQPEVEAYLSATLSLLKGADIAVACVSTGGSPSLKRAHEVSCATEHRAGSYIYNDRTLAEGGDCDWADCALSVRATVISRPTLTRAIIDAGTKALTSDSFGLEGFGQVVEYPDMAVRQLHEEHGILDLPADQKGPDVGDTLHVIPNHACVVSNMFDRVFLKDPDGAYRAVTVAARGLVW